MGKFTFRFFENGEWRNLHFCWTWQISFQDHGNTVLHLTRLYMRWCVRASVAIAIRNSRAQNRRKSTPKPKSARIRFGAIVARSSLKLTMIERHTSRRSTCSLVRNVTGRSRPSVEEITTCAMAWPWPTSPPMRYVRNKLRLHCCSWKFCLGYYTEVQVRDTIFKRFLSFLS